MPSFPVVLDACALFPRSLRGMLVELARRGVYRAHWSPGILAEVRRAWLEKYPDMNPEQADGMLAQMNLALPDALLPDAGATVRVSLPDSGDAHVVAAALSAKAGTIVTFNRQDFPQAALDPLGIQALHPDEFLLGQVELAPQVACSAVRDILGRYRSPPMPLGQWTQTLLKLGMPKTAACLKYHLNDSP